MPGTGRGEYQLRDQTGLIRQKGSAGVNAAKPTGPAGPMQGPNGRPKSTADIPAGLRVPQPVQVPNRGVAAQQGGIRVPSVSTIPMQAPSFSPYPGHDDPTSPRFESPNGGPSYNPLTGEWR